MWSVFMHAGMLAVKYGHHLDSEVTLSLSLSCQFSMQKRRDVWHNSQTTSLYIIHKWQWQALTNLITHQRLWLFISSLFSFSFLSMFMIWGTFFLHSAVKKGEDRLMASSYIRPRLAARNELRIKGRPFYFVILNFNKINSSHPLLISLTTWILSNFESSCSHWCSLGSLSLQTIVCLIF